MKKFYLLLENGKTYEGLGPEGQEGETSGEVVFTTGMTGYPETLTDPSYAGQILVFTYPLIGNYGVPDQAVWESEKIHAKGVVICKGSPYYYHYQANSSFYEWLQKEKVFLMEGVDTRALTKILRSYGTMHGTMTSNPGIFSPFLAPTQDQILSSVSCKQRRYYGSGKKRVIAIDCGIKQNLIRMLVNLGVEVIQVSYNDDFVDEDYDGVFLSNGPGDPSQCYATIEILKKVMKKEKPIFGVCLGNQLLASAAGACTYKLKFGHRGQNQPCIHLRTGKCYITSQNHGFAVDEKTLPNSWEVTYRNLNDHSVEGIAHKELPFFAVQFHPEANPGPTDTQWLFKQFVDGL